MALKGLAGKVVVVTGAASGIGEAAVRRLAAEGCRVAVADRQQERAQAIARELGDRALGVGADVGSREQLDAMFDTVLQRFGRLDGLVNNAAIPGPAQRLQDVEPDAFDQVMAVNARAVFLGMQRAFREFARQGGGGSIVNTAALAGITGFPGLVAYVAAKHAVVGMTKVAAGEGAAQGVRVNAVCPGMIRTAIADVLPREAYEQMAAAMPFGRAGQPQEVGDLIAWLLSDEAAYVSGQAISVDGALTACVPGFGAGK